MTGSRIVVAAAVLAGMLGSAEAADYRMPVQPGPVLVQPQGGPDPVVALCANPHTLSRIRNRFTWAERHTWHRGFVMAALENPRVNYPMLNGPSMISQVRCIADATMTDNTQRTVFYSVEAEMGFASIGKGVDFCVLGLDPWRIHDDECRTVR